MNISMTIAAIATPPGNGGIGILRLSGPAALEAVRRVAPKLPETLKPRYAYVAAFVDSQGTLWDEGLVLYFQGPNSFTGEDVVELHAHGSSTLLKKLLSLVLSENVRLAQPGEFTRRAFLNGKMDLTAAEAVADLVSAESEAALRAAASQYSGALRARLDGVRSDLMALRADIEGVLDFPSEAEGADDGLLSRLASLQSALCELVGDAQRGQWLRRGIRVVLYGPVNAGKSTLFNALAKEERALVDDSPGTTRDVLEARLNFNGVSITWVDTAGLREGDDVGRVEKMGILRTQKALAQADVAVLVHPPLSSHEEARAWRQAAGQVPLIEIQGKADGFTGPTAFLRVSGQTGEGVVALQQRVFDVLWGGHTPQAVALLSERHAEALSRAEKAIHSAVLAHTHSTLEAVAGELAWASEALAEVTGEHVSTQLLDLIFQRFCIGK